MKKRKIFRSCAAISNQIFFEIKLKGIEDSERELEGGNSRKSYVDYNWQMFKNFFRRRKKKKQEVVKEEEERDAFAAASSVGELLSIGKDVRVISVMFSDVKLV